MLTRGQVAKILGISYSRVRTLMRLGKLLGDRRPDGVWQFDPKLVYRLASQRAERAIEGTKRGSIAELDGRLVARVFHYFEMQWTVGQIVIAEELPPAIVRGLYAEYMTPLGQRSPPWHRARRGRPIIRSVGVKETSEPVGSALEALAATATAVRP